MIPLSLVCLSHRPVFFDFQSILLTTLNASEALELVGGSTLPGDVLDSTALKTSKQIRTATDHRFYHAQFQSGAMYLCRP